MTVNDHHRGSLASLRLRGYPGGTTRDRAGLGDSESSEFSIGPGVTAGEGPGSGCQCVGLPVSGGPRLGLRSGLSHGRSGCHGLRLRVRSVLRNYRRRDPGPGPGIETAGGRAQSVTSPPPSRISAAAGAKAGAKGAKCPVFRDLQSPCAANTPKFIRVPGHLDHSSSW